jgi:hypothetical protein
MAKTSSVDRPRRARRLPRSSNQADERPLTRVPSIWYHSRERREESFIVVPNELRPVFFVTYDEAPCRTSQGWSPGLSRGEKCP